ncbi:MarR family winged helix-turn-helix transcriptional regulator [Actinoalloteichus hymeniacidonis]|uniref:Transcriptional regulator n=1 Tax=Actinoalloteichus hymeniacidonis TaxID=340345 RepID=A0AAC9HPI6_9PSEU|nr:MarR family winged helix-turn-helix transcriptional regulator [Actinoalloteichus hymeniacidonis]AOS63070.1 transcriptional regulator [Actinoalloteichus hymeniacidonis]MBB5908894.1 DNA-binding MarR family transcriptional regulator [Actinoalloteichus hymeniacidonis]
MDEARWLTDEQQRAWRKLAGVITVLPAALDTQLQRDESLTHFGYWVMALLSEAEQRSARMSDLAAKANASPSRLSHVVSRLEKQGWVRRQRCDQDRRGSLAVLTDAGYEKVVAAAPGHANKVRELLFDGLDDDQVRQLDDICAVLLRQMGYHADTAMPIDRSDETEPPC